MTGYTFVYGVDGFGADTAPAYEEGVFLDYEKAWNHFKNLTQKILKERDQVFYEEGYGEDFWPEEDELTNLWNEMEKRDFDDESTEKFSASMDNHILCDIDEICNRINEYDDPPYGFYQMIEIEVIE